MILYKNDIRVQYFETDQMQFVHHARYIEYFERARTEMLRELGLPYSEIEALGYFMPVLEIGIKYKSPAFYEDLLVIETRMIEYKPPIVRLDHKIYKKDTDILVVEGFVKLAFISKETKRPVKPPKVYSDMVNRLFMEYENAK